MYLISVNSGIFPDLMKIAKIRLLKKGDKLDIQNYRPVSVLSVFSKILEKIMYNRLLIFLKKYKISAVEHIGFRDNKSTETACHTFIENIQQALDTNLHVVGIFLNLFKAYGVINHDICFIDYNLMVSGVISIYGLSLICCSKHSLSH